MTEATGRQRILEDIPGWQAARLRTSRVVIAGGGALGAEIALQLALVGVGRLVLSDSGTVRPEDVASSGVFDTGDLGRPRGATLALRLGAIAPAMRVHASSGGPLALGAGVVSHADLVVAVDTSQRSRLLLDRWCRRAGRPWVDARIDVYHGAFRVFDARSGPCFECGISDSQRESLAVPSPSPPDPPVLSAPPTAAVVAGLVVQSALRLLGPCEGLPSPAGTETCYNGWSGELAARALTRSETCEHPEPTRVVSGPWSCETRVGVLLRAARDVLGEDAALELDRPVAWRLRCDRCGAAQNGFRSALTLGEGDLACANCGGFRRPDLLARIAGQASCLGLPVRAMGLPPLALFLARSRAGAVVLEPAGDRSAALGVTA